MSSSCVARYAARVDTDTRLRAGVMACSSRASTSSVAVATYFLGRISATAIAVTIVAARAITNALRRARRARMNWLRSMVFLSSLKEGFLDEDDVVGLDDVA